MFGREMALVFESYVGEAPRVRDYLEKDFDGMGAEEAVECLERAEHILTAYMEAAEALDPCLFACLGEARARAREARLVAEGYLAAGFPSIRRGHR
jgi:hypothetical protein